MSGPRIIARCPVTGYVPPMRLHQQALARRRRQQVVAADHVRDGVVEVVDGVRELVRRDAVAAQQHVVAEQAVLPAHLAAHEVLDDRLALGRRAEADRRQAALRLVLGDLRARQVALRPRRRWPGRRSRAPPAAPPRPPPACGSPGTPSPSATRRVDDLAVARRAARSAGRARTGRPGPATRRSPGRASPATPGSARSRPPSRGRRRCPRCAARRRRRRGARTASCTARCARRRRAGSPSATGRSGRGPPRPRYRTGRCSSARTSRRAAASGGHPSARSSWAATATRCSPRTRGPGASPSTRTRTSQRFRELARDVGPAVAHAIYFINLRHDDPEVYRKSVDTLREHGAQRAPARPRRRRLPRRLAQGPRPRRHAAADRDGHALGAGGARRATRWLLLENSAGAGDTIGRDTERPRRASSRPSTTRASASASTPATSTSRASTSAGAPTRTPSSSASTARSASSACAACTSTTAPRRSARTATATPTSARASSAPTSACCSPTRACRACRRSWRRRARRARAPTAPRSTA